MSSIFRRICVRLVAGALIFPLLLEADKANQTDNPSFNISAYYESWSQFLHPSWGRKQFTIKDIDPDLLNDLYYAFAIFGFETEDESLGSSKLTGDFTVRPLYANETTRIYPQLVELKRRSGGRMKSFLSVGGANFNNPEDPLGMGGHTYKLFSEMAASPEKRKQLIDSMVSYAHRFGFDGIDIDWEFPGDLTRGGSEKDFENFIYFLKEAKEKFHGASPPLLLSFAVAPAPPPGLPAAFHQEPDRYYRWVAKGAEFADRVVIMAYNYHTPFDQERQTGVNAPLYRDTQEKSTLFIAHSLDRFIADGSQTEKMLLGIPVYGWSYGGVSGLKPSDLGPGKPFTQPGFSGPHLLSPGFLAYFEIADLIAKSQLFFGTDLTTSTAYAYNIKDKQWVSFDTPQTVALKVNEAKKRRLGGVIFWAIDLDEYQWHPKFPNIRAALQ